ATGAAATTVGATVTLRVTRSRASPSASSISVRSVSRRIWASARIESGVKEMPLMEPL
ncbi:hypothetical protein HMPREF0731_2033, partial [Pseudoroseomonas cervicalis ATCC 49957]